MEPKQKQHPVVGVTGDGSKVRWCKEQYCIGIWNVRFTNQGKLEMIKQEMERVNIDILGIRELKQTGIGEFNAILGCNLRNERMISISFQGKPFSITVVQVYVPTSNTKKLKLNSLWWPTRPSRTNTKNRYPFHHRGLECKSRKSRDTWNNRQI